MGAALGRLAALAVGLLARLGLLARPLAVPLVALPWLVPCSPGFGQVACVPALPGRFTPQTGGEP